MEARNLRKERTGVVVSNKMDKTITVAAKFKLLPGLPIRLVRKRKWRNIITSRILRFAKCCVKT